jgi:hypothetical protein
VSLDIHDVALDHQVHLIEIVVERPIGHGRV